MQDYRKLRVWQRAHQMAVDAYTLPKYLKQPEGWPLRDQILRAAISIQANVAEGAGRGSNPDFIRFCWHSMGSCNEFESDILLAHNVKLIPSDIHTRLGNEVSEIRRMLTRFMETLKE
jgi:four helix bundle protein